MPTPVAMGIRAAVQRGVELIAALNRRRLPKADSPFVVGIHTPMAAELTLEHLAVTGAIPPGLSGRYLKMGANPVNPDPAGITGSWVTAWSTASPSQAAARTGIATAGSGRGWRQPHSAGPQRPARGGAGTTP